MNNSNNKDIIWKSIIYGVIGFVGIIACGIIINRTDTKIEEARLIREDKYWTISLYGNSDNEIRHWDHVNRCYEKNGVIYFTDEDGIENWITGNISVVAE